eukprot:222626_1
MTLLLKIGFLGFRAGTKIISKRFKKEAQKHATFKRICVSFAQNYQELITMTNVKILSNVKIKHSKRMSDQEAVELGADMMAEIMIWSAAVLQVFAVYYWQMSEKEAKRQQLDSTFQNIQAEFDNIQQEFDTINNEIFNVKSYLAVHCIDDAPTEECDVNLI